MFSACASGHSQGIHPTVTRPGPHMGSVGVTSVLGLAVEWSA